jgi:superfamily II helicase
MKPRQIPNPDKVLEILTRARALLSEEVNWTQNSFARTADGVPIQAEDPKACKFCMVGALNRANFEANTNWWVERIAATDVLRCAIGGSITGYNDNPYCQHSNVLKAFDRAIACAKEQTT